MRILTVLESPSWVDHHIVGSLQANGHEVTRFIYGTHVGEYYGSVRAAERERKNSELLQLAKSMHKGSGLDLIFCYVYDDFLLPAYAKKLAALDVAMVNFNVDMVNQWYRQTRTAKFFTRILCAQRANMHHLEKHGAKVMYFPMAARMVGLAEPGAWQPSAPVTFVGTPMAYRTRVLGWLNQQQVSLAVYGKFWLEHRQASPDHNIEKTINDMLHYGWPRLRAEGPGALLQSLRQRFTHSSAGGEQQQLDALPDSLLHGFLPEADMLALFRNSSINLGFTRMSGDDPAKPGVNQVKLRDFEVPMAGGFYLVEQAPDYDELFKPGVEVETWRTPGELLEKIRYYLEHPAERTAIALAGMKRARAEHAWHHRLAMLFAELGLKH